MFKKIGEFFKKIPGGVADFVINKILFLLMGSKLKGYRTIILNVGTMVLAVWEFISKDGGLFDLLCGASETFNFLIMFCDIDKGEFYAAILVVINFVNVLLRKLTTGPIGYNGPENYTAYETSNTLNFVLTGTVGVFIAFLVKLFS